MDISLSLTYPSCSAHMKLTIRNLQYGDFGNYRCISKNSLGETEGSIRVYGKCMCIGDLSALVTANIHTGTQAHRHTHLHTPRAMQYRSPFVAQFCQKLLPIDPESTRPYEYMCTIRCPPERKTKRVVASGWWVLSGFICPMSSTPSPASSCPVATRRHIYHKRKRKIKVNFGIVWLCIVCQPKESPPNI